MTCWQTVRQSQHCITYVTSVFMYAQCSLSVIKQWWLIQTDHCKTRNAREPFISQFSQQRQKTKGHELCKFKLIISLVLQKKIVKNIRSMQKIISGSNSHNLRAAKVKDFTVLSHYNCPVHTCTHAHTHTHAHTPVMWSETVGLRTRLVWDQKKNRSWSCTLRPWVLQVWYCFVKNDLVTLVVIMILKDTATFQVLFIVSLFCAWNITTVEINSGVYLLKN